MFFSEQSAAPVLRFGLAASARATSDVPVFFAGPSAEGVAVAQVSRIRPSGCSLPRSVAFRQTPQTSTSLVDSFEDRDAFVASGMESGVVQGYERLDAMLDALGNS